MSHSKDQRFYFAKMKKVFCCCVILLALLGPEARAARVAMLQMFGGSHFMTTKSLGDELVKRGHQVTIFLPGEKSLDGKRTNLSNSITILHFDGGHDDKEYNSQLQSYLLKRELSLLEEFQFFKLGIDGLGNICSSLLQHDIVLKEVREADLIIGEILLTCSGFIAKKFNKPWIGLAAASYVSVVSLAHDVYLNPSYFPELTGLSGEQMSFSERVVNYLLYQGSPLLYLLLRFDSWLDTAYKLGYPRISISEASQSAQIIVANCDFAMLFAFPQMPNYVCAGAFLTKPPAKLPQDLDAYLNSSKHGVVLVAFGTAFGVYSAAQKNAMLSAFAKLDENVLWQIKDDSNLTLPPNVKTVKWIPQNDVLAHPNIKLFVSHVGQSSMLEAGYHGVPVLAVPRGLDQFFNAQIVRSKVQMGEILKIRTADADEWYHKLRLVLDNPSYRVNAQKTSRRMRTKKPGIELAGDLVEYVAANDYDVSHLRSPGLGLPWYKKTLLDVYMFFITVALSIVFLAYQAKRFFVVSINKLKRD